MRRPSEQSDGKLEDAGNERSFQALVREHDRPLIIDQPEETLDPKSIYDELVRLLALAK